MGIEAAVMKPEKPKPLVVAVEMGYGHLRAAYTLADAFGVDVVRMDQPPFAGRAETLLWKSALHSYAMLSRGSEHETWGAAAQWALGKITAIAPPPTNGSLERPNLFSRAADFLTGNLIGRKLRAVAEADGRRVLATFPAPAFAAQRLPGAQVFCLATDTDLNRGWAPVAAEKSRVRYFAPTARVVDRLRSFGVRSELIHLTGFPLPARLVEKAPTALACRLQRLDTSAAFRRHPPKGFAEFSRRHTPADDEGPIALTVAIGGAGAQTRQARALVESLQELVRSGKVKLTLIAGVRVDVAQALGQTVNGAGLGDRIGRGVEIHLASSLREYFRIFDDCLAATHLLWTKPSELAFYAALGIPLLLSAPVGAQEIANRNWLLSRGAALDAGDPRSLADRLERWLHEGELCRAAWSGYSGLARDGLDHIVDIVSTTSSRDISYTR